MKFINLKEFGSAEQMFVDEMEIPEPNANEVLIKVHAAGINRPDVIQRQGNYPAPPGASPVLGLEVAGEITAIGAGVTQWKVGDKVCALTNGGAYAEYAVAPEGQCLPIPSNLSMVEAAALPETLFTVWSNVFERAQLKEGETLLVHGGSSGIGTSAIQMAKAMGATVYTTVGSEEKQKACLALGADLAINYHNDDFEQMIKERGDAINVTLDMVGGPYIKKNIKVAALEGRIVNIAYLQGPVAEVNFLPVMLKRLQLTGSTLRPQSESQKAHIAEQLKAHIWPKIEESIIKPLIAKTFSLDEVVDAHKLMESNQHIGKIILEIM